MMLHSRARRMARPALVLLVLSGAPPVDSPARPALSPGTLEAVAPMSAARAAHTATPLPDERVLIVGGFTAPQDAAQGAEIYDGRAQRYVTLPRMLTLRHSHTATVLSDGKVLIVGGYGAGNETTAAAELFDPVSRKFLSTGSLLAPRAGHIAVLLGNGKVLIAGGIGPGWTFLASAELYDPGTGTFAATGAMTDARESHTASRLQDGRVLVVGGHRGRRSDITLYASAEAYDPATGRFTPAGDMLVRRHKHDAVLLRDGRVLVTGGADERDSRGTFDTTELFDPASGTFTAGPRMQLARYKHQTSSTVLPNGMVLIAGGAPQAEVYDPVSRTFSLVGGDGRMAGQFSAVAPLGDGRVLITGGYGSRSGPQPLSWLYRP
jgi:hypothetical protein